MLPKVELEIIFPWAVISYLLFCRMRLYCYVRPYVTPGLCLFLLWRAVFETDDTTILSFVNRYIHMIITSPVLLHLAHDLIGIVILSFTYQMIIHTTSFSFENAYARAFKLIENLPMVANELHKERVSVEADLERSLKSQQRQMGAANSSLPRTGQQPSQIINMMSKLARKDDVHWQTGRVSGAVYLGDLKHVEFLNEAFGLYSLSNPLHAELWPSIMKYESEIIAMVADMMNGGDSSVVGCVTSGGTESIVLAIKTHRDYYREKFGITEPEMIACTSAHAAVNKGCDLLGVKLIHVPLNPDTYEIDLNAVKRAIGPNTILMYR